MMECIGIVLFIVHFVVNRNSRQVTEAMSYHLAARSNTLTNTPILTHSISRIAGRHMHCTGCSGCELVSGTLPAGAPKPRSHVVMVQVPFLRALHKVKWNRLDYIRQGRRKEEWLWRNDASLIVGRNLHIHYCSTELQQTTVWSEIE